jgi:hypothetical protein
MISDKQLFQEINPKDIDPHVLRCQRVLCNQADYAVRNFLFSNGKPEDVPTVDSAITLTPQQALEDAVIQEALKRKITVGKALGVLAGLTITTGLVANSVLGYAPGSGEEDGSFKNNKEKKYVHPRAAAGQAVIDWMDKGMV